MSEFVFKNLSVKLFPAEGEARPLEGDCIDCSRECTNAFTCGPCTDIPTCAAHPATAECEDPVPGHPCDRGCAPGTIPCDDFTNIVPIKADVGDILARVAARKEQVRQYLGEIEAGEWQLRARVQPRSVEEIDLLRSQLLAAVAELDEQRAELEGGGPRQE
jgi:hypothetical protein